MVDTWEIFGRLITDTEFRGAVLAAGFAGKYAIDPHTQAVKILEPDYDLALGLARKKIHDRPISLMALGELIVALVYPKFRAGIAELGKAIEAKFETGERDPRFFVCLGAMFFDSGLATALVRDSKEFAARGFLAPNYAGRGKDLETLQEMFDPAKSPEIVNAVQDTCSDNGTPWELSCSCRDVFWPAHYHPAENPLPPNAILP